MTSVYNNLNLNPTNFEKDTYGQNTHVQDTLAKVTHEQDTTMKVTHDQDTSEHFSKNDWKNMSHIDLKLKKVLDVLSSINLDTNNKIIYPDSSKNVTELQIIGLLYEYARNNSVQKKGKTSMKKIDIIKTENMMKNIKKDIEMIDSFFVNKNDKWDYCKIPTESYNSYEMRGHFLLRALQYSLENYVSSNEESVYELLIIVDKFLNIINQFDNFSGFLKNEINIENINLRNHIKFSSSKILTVYPKLTVVNNFDKILPGKQNIQFMEHQKTILNTIIENLDSGFLIKYSVMAGYGKTTTAVPLGKLIENVNKLPKYKSTQFKLVYACNIGTVRSDVVKYFFHEGVQFCNIARRYWEKDPKRWYMKCHPSYPNPPREIEKIESKALSFRAKECTAFITGPEFAVDIIKFLENEGYKVILFLDEPTVGADTKNSTSLKMNADLLANIPECTIIASATLPVQKSIQCVTDSYKERFPNGNSNIPAISLCDVKIGCEVFTYDQTPYPVYSGISTSGELENITSVIHENGFVRKMCDISSLQKLSERMTKNSLDTFDMKNWTNDLSNLTPEKISMRLASQLSLLESIGNNEQIKKVCRLKSGKNNSINFKNLLNEHTVWMSGMTLIATQNPEEFIKDNFEGFINELCESYDINKSIVAYNKDLEIYNKLIDEIEKAEISAKKKRTKIAKSGKIMDDEQKTKDINKTNKVKCPVFKFMEKFQINSKSHCDHIISQNSSLKCCHENHQTSFPCGSEMSADDKNLYSINVDTNLILLLMSGIGVCSKNIKNSYYKDFVFNYASKGLLSFVITDETICFGTNYPFTRVFIEDDFALNHSMETINQVVARGGRLGMSYKCFAYFPNSMQQRLYNYMQTGKDMCFDEGKNITENVMIVITEKRMELFENFQMTIQNIFNSYVSIVENMFDVSLNLITSNVSRSMHINLKINKKLIESESDSDDLPINFDLNKNVDIKNDNDDWENIMDDCKVKSQATIKKDPAISNIKKYEKKSDKKAISKIEEESNWRDKNMTLNFTDSSDKKEGQTNWRNSIPVNFTVSSDKKETSKDDKSNWRNMTETSTNTQVSNNETKKYIPPSKRK
jgi:hypothetical protein